VKSRRFEILLAVCLGTVFASFVLWQTPALWRSPLSALEIDRYTAAMEQHIAQPAEDKAAFIGRMRAWAAGDDGKPVLMLNLMRFRQQLGALPAHIEFSGSPASANDYYEGLVAPLALKRGEYPLLGGDTQAGSLTGPAHAAGWDRVVVMRAPSRRAFMEFIADSEYGPSVPYKLAAADVELIPLDAGMTIPDLRWLIGGLLFSAYLTIGWWRSASALRRTVRAAVPTNPPVKQPAKLPTKKQDHA
jgi:hypothetical protein